MGAPLSLSKKFFDKLSNETHFVGLSLEKAAARCSALASLARLRAEKYFADVHAAGKKALNFICACGRKLCEAFSIGCAGRLNGRTAFRPFQKGKNMVK